MEADRPKSVRNGCVIEVFDDVCVLSRCQDFDLSVGVGLLSYDCVRSLPLSLNLFLYYLGISFVSIFCSYSGFG